MLDAAMSVELTLYRSRTGALAACLKPRCLRTVTAYCNPESKHSYWTDFTVRMIVCTAFLYALAEYGYCWQLFFTSNFVVSMCSAMLGEYAHDLLHGNVTRCISVYYTIDLSGILLLGGDIESKPGPVEMEDLQKALANLTETLTNKFQAMMAEEMQKLRNDIAKVDKKLDDLENDIALIRSKVDHQEACVD